jgi:hypothetical protein
MLGGDASAKYSYKKQDQVTVSTKDQGREAR